MERQPHPPVCLLFEAALATAARLNSCHVDHKGHQAEKYLLVLEGK